MKKYLSFFVAFFFPSFLAVYVLRLFGHSVHKSCKIGFSVILVKKMSLSEGARIGHFNFIKCSRIEMGTKAYMQKFNVIKGDIDIILAETASIGNCNVITRAPAGITYGEAVLQMGILSKFTAFHKVDLTRSITIGDYTTFAGQSSQVWTHGYYHHRKGPGRFRVDGEIIIGNNVYIGSRCVVNQGLKIADGATVGSNSTISKSLNKPGLYVSQPLRFIEKDPDEVESTLSRVTGYDNLQDIVYEKRV